MPASRLVDEAQLRNFVVEVLAKPQSNLAQLIEQTFGISRATAHSYIRGLIEDETIVRIGHGRYQLSSTDTWLTFRIEGLEEHVVWADHIEPLLTDLPTNVTDLWRYGCTEMVNNAIDHSEDHSIQIEVIRWPHATDIRIYDEGVGIFRKIRLGLGLDDDRHAVLELSKGKVTTDPDRHTGEGIFFSSRAFDSFQILSGGVFFSHVSGDDEDWILGNEQPRDPEGTTVLMRLKNDSPTILGDVFDEYATDTEDFRFDRTVVPVKLTQYGDDELISRSQAKRLIRRFDRFRKVVLDFDDVPSIGQGFADEIFRVFPKGHPNVEIVPINANEQVSRMIGRVRTAN